MLQQILKEEGNEMKEIRLTQNKVTLVDDEDFERLNKQNWHAQRNKQTWYAVHSHPYMKMHQRIIDIPKELVTDHRDGNGLNNQKANLHAVTIRENAQNRHVQKTSRYPGVYWHKIGKKWAASIRIDKNSKHLGLFRIEEDAYNAYKTACESLKTPNSSECGTSTEY
jgi:phenylalanyl-tRNA synthetase alpha subunit